MILSPFPMMGWSDVVKTIRHVAMAVDLTTSGVHRSSNLHYRVSGDGLRWQHIRIEGDLAAYTTSNGGPGAFECFGIVHFKGAWFAHGVIWTSTTANTGAIFRTTDGRKWDLLSVPYGANGPTTTGTLREYEYAAAGADYIVAMKPTGEFVYSSNGTDWSGRTDLVGYTTSFGPALAARGVAVTSGGITVVGTVAQSDPFRFKTASTPSGAFTDRGAFVGGKDVRVVAQGNIVLALSIFSSSIGGQRSAYAPADNLTSWGDAGFTVETNVGDAFFLLGHWYAGSGTDWLVSEGASGTPGVGGWTPVDVPWDGEDVMSGYQHDGRAFVHFGNGRLATSQDGEDFIIVANTNLAAKPYFACAA